MTTAERGCTADEALVVPREVALTRGAELSDVAVGVVHQAGNAPGGGEGADDRGIAGPGARA